MGNSCHRTEVHPVKQNPITDETRVFRVPLGELCLKFRKKDREGIQLPDFMKEMFFFLLEDENLPDEEFSFSPRIESLVKSMTFSIDNGTILSFEDIVDFIYLKIEKEEFVEFFVMLLIYFIEKLPSRLFGMEWIKSIEKKNPTTKLEEIQNLAEKLNKGETIFLKSLFEYFHEIAKKRGGPFFDVMDDFSYALYETYAFGFDLDDDGHREEDEFERKMNLFDYLCENYEIIFGSKRDLVYSMIHKDDEDVPKAIQDIRKEIKKEKAISESEKQENDDLYEEEERDRYEDWDRF